MAMKTIHIIIKSIGHKFTGAEPSTTTIVCGDDNTYVTESFNNEILGCAEGIAEGIADGMGEDEGYPVDPIGLGAVVGDESGSKELGCTDGLLDGFNDGIDEGFVVGAGCLVFGEPFPLLSEWEDLLEDDDLEFIFDPRRL